MKDMDILNEEPTPNLGMNAQFSMGAGFGTTPADGLGHFPNQLDIIEEFLKEHSELPSSGLPLPGPPPPPPDPFCLTPSIQNHNHRTVQQNQSMTCSPVLVSRGAACKPNFLSLQQRPAGSSRDVPSTHPSHLAPSSLVSSSCRGRGPSCSPASKGSVSSQNQGDTKMLEQILEKPRLVVVEEPKDRGMRFRYQCEGRSAGSILGASSTDNNKTQPTIEIQGPIDRIKNVTVTASLVTKDLPHRPHPHCLVGKDCPLDSGICVVRFNPHANRCHSFTNLGIQCVRRKELDVSLQKRRSQNIDPFQTGHSKGIEDMDMNAVRLCFQCELEWEDGRKDSLSPVVSKPIYDKKATTTSELKIYNLNLHRGSCRGKTEIYMLCDKVQKDDIEILFRHGSWKANGEFAQTDVHRQIAIVFKTPPYQDQDITEEIEVDVVLRRVSDQMESDSVTFIYTPHNQDPYEVKRKRATIKRDVSEKSCVTETTAPPSEPAVCFPQNQDMMSPNENQPPIQPVNFFQDSDVMDEEEMISQLLLRPEILNALSDPSFSFDMVCDPNATYTNIDMNFNANFSTSQQDISPQFNDFQFNMLVHENQNPEPQDGVMQVKKEEP